ncbi:MAG: hypothetical protein FWB76_02380 [Oscillospiraceae bacterium]|nr:hypothetical protein [Oscillospiraceae bacterium]
MKKVLSTLLAVAMLLSLVAVTAAAYTYDTDYIAEPAVAVLSADAELQAQGHALLTNTLNVFGSGSYYLRGTATQPVQYDGLFNVLPPRTADVVIAADAGRVTVEQNVSWSSELGFFRGFFMRLVFGNRVRMMVSENNDPRVVFPNRRFFFSLQDMGDAPILDLEALDLVDLGDLDIPAAADLAARAEGNYLQVTLENADGGYTHFFYRSSQLRRIVSEMPEGNTVIVVHHFSGNPPARLFSAGWMLYVPMGWFVRLFNA